MITATVLLVWGVVLHLIGDWILQNDYIAKWKSNPKHPAGYVHAGIHALLLTVLFFWPIAVTIGVIHWLIDLRWTLNLWRIGARQTRITNPDEAPYPTPEQWAVHVGLGFSVDQVAHILVIAMAALFVGLHWSLPVLLAKLAFITILGALFLTAVQLVWKFEQAKESRKPKVGL